MGPSYSYKGHSKSRVFQVGIRSPIPYFPPVDKKKPLAWTRFFFLFQIPGILKQSRSPFTHLKMKNLRNAGVCVTITIVELTENNGHVLTL